MPFPDYDDEIEAAYEAQETAMPNKPELPMNSKLQQILLDFLKEDDDGNVNLSQAEKAILALFDRYATEREREAVKRYELETSIERLDVQCSEGNCKNCDNKRPRLRKLQEELAALKETTK